MRDRAPGGRLEQLSIGEIIIIIAIAPVVLALIAVLVALQAVGWSGGDGAP